MDCNGLVFAQPLDRHMLDAWQTIEDATVSALAMVPYDDDATGTAAGKMRLF
jgi:hypothetical protein